MGNSLGGKNWKECPSLHAILSDATCTGSPCFPMQRERWKRLESQACKSCLWGFQWSVEAGKESSRAQKDMLRKKQGKNKGEKRATEKSKHLQLKSLDNVTWCNQSALFERMAHAYTRIVYWSSKWSTIHNCTQILVQTQHKSACRIPAWSGKFPLFFFITWVYFSQNNGLS